MAGTDAALDDATLRLLLARGVGPVLHERLLAAFGSPEGVLRASRSELACVEGIGSRRAEEIVRALGGADPEAERSALERVGARILMRRHPAYPNLLRVIPDPPPAIWVRGNLAALRAPAVAIVGSRRCTLYGREQAARLAAGLADCGLTVVSGGARGIDAAAHQAALRVRAPTIAVLGCGLGHCYPPEHVGLFESIAVDGLLISELPMGVGPRAEGFPRRNRLISGLALGVVVVEAALRSGALITAREAVEGQNREVMALPGRVDSPVSAGCHRAIREGWAGLVTGVDDVIAQLASAGRLLEGASESAGDQAPGVSSPADEEAKALRVALQRLLASAPTEASWVQAGALSQGLGVPIGQVLAALLLLEIDGVVVRSSRGYRATRSGPPTPGDGGRVRRPCEGDRDSPSSNL